MEAQALSRPTLLAFYERHRRAFRVGGHVAMWLAVYFLLIKDTYPRIFEDNERVGSVASFAALFQAMVLYYSIGHYVFPKFFYKRDYAKLILILATVFFVIYQINYLLFYYLDSISNKVRPDGKFTYVRKIFRMVQEAGWLGCFTSLRVFLWNLSYNCFLPIFMLVTKGFRDIIDYQKRLVTAEKDKFALELSFLKAQVNPHFLFNTLNSVYARVFDSDEQAADLILRLSELMRYNLYETDVAKITLDKELSYIQNYLDLERNRLSDQYVVIDYEQSGNPSAYQIAPLLLIAFVENAFKHGVKRATEPSYVQVSANLTDGKLVFRVQNSVPHRREAPPAESEPLVHSDRESGGIGLVNVRRRLDALYKGRYELVVTPNLDTYLIVLTMRLETVSTMTSVRV
ncbi:sensor histidine kinase [Spirosoma arcticum]